MIKTFNMTKRTIRSRFMYRHLYNADTCTHCKYQEKGEWVGPHQSFFWYDNDYGIWAGFSMT